MKRALIIAAALVFACLTVFISPTAQAASGDAITRFDVQAQIGADGVATVVETIDMAFAGASHGPYLLFLTRQGYDSSRDRVISYDITSVSSPSGAPVNTQITNDRNNITLRIGDPNRTVTGAQTYIIDYTVSGIINPDQAQSQLDELYWNVIGTAWDLPISNVTVTIAGPADISRTVCYAGSDYADPCDSQVALGDEASFTQASLAPGQGLAVAGGWPAGTFSGVSLKLVSHSQNPFALSSGGAIPAGVAVVVSIAAVLLLIRVKRRGRDEQFANVTPGMVPGAGEKVEVTHAEVRDAAVEFAPPPGIPPRLVGAVVREHTDQVDVTATIIDLAVRGYIHMTQQTKDSFSFSRTSADPHQLTPVDQLIYDKLFATGDTITRETLSDKEFYDTFQQFTTTIEQEFNAQNWYKSSPKRIMAVYRVAGVLVAFAGGGLTLFIGNRLAAAGTLGIGWLILPFLVAGIGLLAIASRMPVRTPVGSAVAIQSFGFKKYLETAEADQIRWEEGQDIFSQYLPYAIAFGCAERWAKLVEDLVAAGAPVPQPLWYSGFPGYHYLAWGAISQSVTNIGTSFTQSISAHAAAQSHTSGGSSGGSAFSGGGFGGGIGGGGGGAW